MLKKPYKTQPLSQASERKHMYQQAYKQAWGPRELVISKNQEAEFDQ